MLLLACLLPAHLEAQVGFALTPAADATSPDRSSVSRPKSNLRLNAEVKHPDRNTTDEECPVCGTNGTEKKNCCSPGGSWYGICSHTENEAKHTFQEGFHACHCENNVVCRLRRDLNRAVTQLDTAKEHQREAMAKKEQDSALNRIALSRNTSKIAHQKAVLVSEKYCPMYIGRFGSGATDQWCQKNCLEIAGLCPNEKCACNTHAETPAVVGARAKPRMTKPEPAPEPAADARAREKAGSIKATRQFEDVDVRSSVPAEATRSPSTDANIPPNHSSPPTPARTTQHPAPSARRPAPSAQRQAPSAKRQAPSAKHQAPKDTQPAPKDTQPAPSDAQPAPKDAQPAPKDAQPDSGSAPSADTQLRRNSLTDELKPAGMGHCGNTGPIKVAVLIAMDIRLPTGQGHCAHAGDSTCNSREDVLKLLNGITKGSDVFVATDRAYKNDVHDDLHHVAAVRYSEDVRGGMPKNMPGQIRQWWRLKQAWGLLEEFEAKCKHTYYWVFKIRTDAVVMGGGDLHTLAMKFDPKVGASRLLTFSDRWFGGRRDTMARMAMLYDNYDRYKGIFGTCGGCELMATLLHEIHSSPKSTQMPLPGKVMAHCDPEECIDTAYGRKFCPLRMAEKQRLWAVTGDAVYRENYDKGAIGMRPWPQPRPPGNHFCILNNMKGKKANAAPAEYSMALHVLSSGLRPLSWSEVGAGLLDTRHQGLMIWRKMIHLWADGVSFGDGPLVPAEQPAAARLMSEIRRHDDGATASAPSGPSSKLERQRQDLHRSMRDAAEGALQWAIPDELRAADGDDEVEDELADYDDWTIVRHPTPFRLYTSKLER